MGWKLTLLSVRGTALNKRQGRQEGAEMTRTGQRHGRASTKVQARKYGLSREGPEGQRPRLGGEKTAFGSRQPAGPGGERLGRGGATEAAGRCTCFRGSCRDSSGCWAAVPASAPQRSHPPRCSLAPFHPHPAIPATRGASRRPQSGPVSPPNRSPAAVQFSVAGLGRVPALAHLRSAVFPCSQAGKLVG